ncbi:tyrosine-type recombinase/integrase [Arthrobacter sp. HMWF013]|uniref:tyrosine-type recombinase/integrase n=1 Tax=Arthrobacter sp. HMWF013 TaxID=2056849 RepID=UPI000D3589C2|nr:tyrosine-type recombinase/integrase [Arthrobacter sp. HMWF013]PTT65105.1 transposase [Arthrobacter sp. HMWF013]
MTGREVRCASTGPGNALPRMRLALSPRFDAAVIVFDDAELAGNLFPVCSVAGCVRFLRTKQMCQTHLFRWKKLGQPGLDEFPALSGPATKPESLNLGGLPERLRIELALAIQLLASQPRERQGFRSQDLRSLLSMLKQREAGSLLSHSGDQITELPDASSAVRRAHTALSSALEHFLEPPNASSEFERDLWRLEVMGFRGRTGQQGRLRFNTMPQPWLRLLAKRFMRWRISTGTSYSQLNRDMTALQRLADAFTEHAGANGAVQHFTRESIEVYLNVLRRLGLSPASRSYSLSSTALFLRAVRENNWEPALPPSAGIRMGDHPRRPAALPRALPEFVMAQIEDPKALEQLEQPHRLMMQILIRTGLRLSDTYRLEIDCLLNDNQNAPYLRYINHKMSREATLPIDDELADAITRQALAVRAIMPEARYLAPARNSRSGDRPWNPGTAAGHIQVWQTTIGLHDEQGHPFRFTAHQLRHTYATRLINADVPQEVVRRLLDHESHEMTARYARLKDETVRRHWEQATKINIHGETISAGQDDTINDAAWMKENLGRVTMALPNGYCGLPLQQACPHANACLTCPVFVTTPDFLSEHLDHLRSTNRLIAEAQTAGQTRVVEMNRRVAVNLESIISTIQSTRDGSSNDAN